MIRLLAGAAVGAVIGAIIGYFGKCGSGTCLITGTPWGGAIFGAVIGAMIASSFARVAPTPKDLANVVDIASRDAYDTAVSGAAGRVVLVDFYSPMCGPCRALMPEIHDLARANAGNLLVLKINAGKNAGLAREHNVEAVPLLLKLKEGKVVGRSTGYRPKEELAAWLFEK